MTTGQTVLYSSKYFRTMVRFKNFFSEMTSTLTTISQRKVENCDFRTSKGDKV